MNKEKVCDCLIGEWLAYEDTMVVTKQELINRIEDSNRVITFKSKPVTIADYCDFRKSVNLIRFRFCPECGRKIDWNSIKKG